MKLAACVVVKNEERGIAEWIAFHLIIGFDSILVYDNQSTDSTANVVDALGAMFDVRLLSWPESGGRWQLGAYDDALARYGSEFTWIAFLDADEFLFPLEKGAFSHMLQTNKEAAAIAIPWMMFGSNGHRNQPSQLITEAYTRRAEQTFGPNQHVKSLVRPKCIERALNPHAFVVRGEASDSTRGYADTSGNSVTWLDGRPGVLASPATPGLMRINHYFVRSSEDWKAKVTRGYNGTDSRKTSDFIDYDQNVIQDFSAAPFSAAVKQTLRRANLAIFRKLPFE